MKFKNKKTGVVLVPTTKFTEEQMKKSDLYEEVKDTKASKKEDTKTDK